ncbi:MFS transporter, partial [Streptomyces violascens]
IVNAIADAQKNAGRTGPDLYTTSFFIMIGLLVVGFAANELVRPVHPRHHEPPPTAGESALLAPEKGALS